MVQQLAVPVMALEPAVRMAPVTKTRAQTTKKKKKKV